MLRCPKRGSDLLKADILVAKLKLKPSPSALAPGSLALNRLKIFLS